MFRRTNRSLFRTSSVTGSITHRAHNKNHKVKGLFIFSYEQVCSENTTAVKRHNHINSVTAFESDTTLGQLPGLGLNITTANLTSQCSMTGHRAFNVPCSFWKLTPQWSSCNGECLLDSAQLQSVYSYMKFHSQHIKTDQFAQDSCYLHSNSTSLWCIQYNSVQFYSIQCSSFWFNYNLFILYLAKSQQDVTAKCFAF